MSKGLEQHFLKKKHKKNKYVKDVRNDHRENRFENINFNPTLVKEWKETVTWVEVLICHHSFGTIKILNICNLNFRIWYLGIMNLRPHNSAKNDTRVTKKATDFSSTIQIICTPPAPIVRNCHLSSPKWSWGLAPTFSPHLLNSLITRSQDFSCPSPITRALVDISCLDPVGSCLTPDITSAI